MASRNTSRSGEKMKRTFEVEILPGVSQKSKRRRGAGAYGVPEDLFGMVAARRLVGLVLGLLSAI
jgi:hypothetical protein